MLFEAGLRQVWRVCWSGREASFLDGEQVIFPWAPGSKVQAFGSRVSEKPQLLLTAGLRASTILNQ